MLNERLKRVAVIGAAGKMGRGISLLFLEEMSRVEASTTGKIGKGDYRLVLIDSTEEAFSGLKSYLRAQILRYAEKNINALRLWFTHDETLVSNGEMIEAFVEGALDNVYYTKQADAALSSSLIFEAVVEDFEVKKKLFSYLKEADHSKALFFTNTSSIPIGKLDEAAGLQGRLIGFHFYNPPPVQKLLEIIPGKKNTSECISFAEELAKRLSKKAIFSHDVAGFIGNGFFVREIDEAFKEVTELAKQKGETEAIFLVNQVTEELLLRPMGIFQLLDYVGIDVIQKVGNIMKQYLGLTLHFQLIDKMVSLGHLGGQHPDGTQKPGFFKYKGHEITDIFSFEKKEYVALPQKNWQEGKWNWKKVSKSKEKEPIIQAYLEELFQLRTEIAQLAQTHLLTMRGVAQGLVKDGVAKNIEDVNQVMINGFYHLYGPASSLIPQNTHLEILK